MLKMLLLMADVYNELGDTPKAISLAKRSSKIVHVTRV